MMLVVRTSEELRRFVSTRRILWALGALVLSLVAMQVVPFGSRAMKALVPGGGVLDMEFAWSSRRAASLFEALGLSGRTLYRGFLGLNFVYAICSAWFQSLTISRLFLKAGLPERFGLVNMLPYAKAVFDLLENVLIFIALSAFSTSLPTAFPGLTITASLATSAKWILYYGCIAALVGLGTATSFATRRTRRNPPQKVPVDKDLCCSGNCL